MLATALFAALVAPAADLPKDPFEFADGDRVVFLGGTLIEREQKYGYWELALTLKNKDKNVVFRNLGWSGDTVWCESRGSFGGQPEGFKNTVALLKELKPTVIVLCYGQVESFDGKDGVKKFTEGLEKLIDAVKDTKARVVLMTPTPFFPSNVLKDAEARNSSLTSYVEAMEQVAKKQGTSYVDLFRRTLSRWDKGGPDYHLGERRGFAKVNPDELTDNGVHLDATGYMLFAPMLLPSDAAPSSGMFDILEASVIKEMQSAEAKKLREAIVAKNELFFHRWRPQNLTYLTGFRKHEQGQNAKEIVQFDPLVEKAEKEIAELRKKVK